MSRHKPVRAALFQLHWLFGISAGLVLALVGTTGALLSYEHTLLRWLNPPAAVAAGTQPMPLNTLFERISAARPDASVQSLTLGADPAEPLRVGFAPTVSGSRGESQRYDRYRGELQPPPRGEAFVRGVMQLHRWLLAGDIGKQVVGASTLALLYLALSGLYLRWPRGRWRSLRTWFLLAPGRHGRGFWWQLHAVFGTWVLLAYLLLAGTGLWWSYGWYRSTLQQLAGVEAPARGGPGSPAAARAAATTFDIDAAIAAIDAHAPGWQQLTLRWPDPAGRLHARYLSANAPHERAYDQLELAVDDYTVAASDRYAERPLGQRLLGSIFALHRGSFFGPLGTVAFMLASLCMPLFAVSGWWLYLDRRRRAGSSSRSAAASGARSSRSPSVSST